jgi:hypothetical protein
MRKAALPFPTPESNPGVRPQRRSTDQGRAYSCIDPVVGSILAGWRFDISGLSPAMGTDYNRHLFECAHCRRRQRFARTIDVLLISVSTLSILAFLLAAVVIHRVELVAHTGTLHVPLPLHQAHVVAISLEAIAITGLLFSMFLWVLVAIATPLPGFLGQMVQQKIPPHLLTDLRDRFNNNPAA